MLNKYDKILVIVESPNKKSTIANILKKAGYVNSVVNASVGHVMELANDKSSWKNSGIWPEDNFRINLKVNSEKVSKVNELKNQAANVDKIFLATDPDREGHVIAWSLIKFLNLDESKCFRMVTHEITPKAVIKALENPIPFDNNMVDAGLARSIIDKLLGFGLSPWAKIYVGAKSVGRCQSVALMLLTDREREIRDFKPEAYYDLYLDFIKNKTKFRAKYCGTADKTIDHFTSKKDVEDVVAKCSSKYKILDIKREEKKENPKPPFDTPSFQQEAASKLKLSIKSAQDCAQKLYSGIEVNGQHVGLITYIRTDATDMSPEFIPDLKSYIETTYGKGTFNTPKVGKKAENAQEGHEALRCTDPNMTPEKLAQYIKNDLLIKVYKLIWQRTIASSMPPAIISKTTYIIENNGQLFNLVSNELIDPGYRAIYSYKDEDDSKEDGPVKETFKKSEQLSDCSLEGVEKTTKPKPRYTEATFNKELQKRGIGRPSTLATIIETVLSTNRNYASIEGKELIPTNLGMNLTAALSRCYPSLINYDFTNKMEQQLDLIAQGKLDKYEFLNAFYNNLTTAISSNSEGMSNDTDKICPECGNKLVIRRNRWGKLFYGCSGYPHCRYLENKN